MADLTPLTNNTVFERIIKAANQYVRDITASRTSVAHGREQISSDDLIADWQCCRVSYVYPRAIEVIVADCLTLRNLYIPSSFFGYEDDGEPDWFEDKDSELRDAGPVVFESK